MIVTTAIYGGYDHVKPHPDHPDVDEWVCYTDDPSLASNSDGWTVRHRPLPYQHPRLSAKWWKCHPPAGVQSLWVDGSVEILTADFIDDVLGSLDGADMAMWVHPWRDCIYQEAGASAPMRKYHDLPLQAQIDHYRSLGWPDRNGLWASTVIGWSGSVEAATLGAAWFSHCEAFTYQDQLSLPPLIARYGTTVRPLPGPFVNPSRVRWHGHRSDL